MPLVLRNVKGSQLTFNEMDGNLTYLDIDIERGGQFEGDMHNSAIR